MLSLYLQFPITVYDSVSVHWAGKESANYSSISWVLWSIIEQSQTHGSGGVLQTFQAFSFHTITNRNTRLSLTVPLCILDCSDIGLWWHHTTLHYGTDILVNNSFQSDPRGKADHTLCPAFKETWKIRWASSQGRAKGGGRREETEREGEIWEQSCKKIRWRGF